jgi:hypothetical protein
MNFEYNQQMEEFSMFDFTEEIHDTTLVTDSGLVIMNTMINRGERI